MVLESARRRSMDVEGTRHVGVSNLEEEEWEWECGEGWWCKRVALAMRAWPEGKSRGAEVRCGRQGASRLWDVLNMDDRFDYRDIEFFVRCMWRRTLR
jgi:hypothetical protein